jgi:hypothetical protein
LPARRAQAIRIVRSWLCVSARLTVSSRNRPANDRETSRNDRNGWSIESAGQELDSGIAAGSGIGHENTLKVETRVRTRLGLEERNMTSKDDNLFVGYNSRTDAVVVAIPCHSTTWANGEVWLRPRTVLRLRPRSRRSSASSVCDMRSLRHPAGGFHRDDSRSPNSSYSMEVKPQRERSRYVRNGSLHVDVPRRLHRRAQRNPPGVADGCV